MKLFLANDEKTLKRWSYDSGTEESKINNSIAITNKRFIYQTELVGDKTQTSISRYEIALKHIKSISSSYHALNKFNSGILFIILGILLAASGFGAIISSLTGSTDAVTIALGLFLVTLGSILCYVGYIASKKPAETENEFHLVIETINQEGNNIRIGQGSVLIKPKQRADKPVKANSLIKAILLIGCFPIGIIYILATSKKDTKDPKKESKKLQIPEEIAIEIIEMIGTLCL